MDYVSKGVLKSKMLAYFRRVEETGREIIVTYNNIPVLKVVALKKKRGPEDVFGDVRGKLVLKGDLTEPTLDEWEDA